MTIFEIFDLPIQVEITVESLDLKHKELLAQHHPDKGGDAELYKNVQSAYEILKIPHLRAIEVLKSRGVTYESRGDVDEKIMDYFMSVSSVLQSADEHIKQCHLATTAIQKAVLAQQTMQCQEAISNELEKLEEAQEKAEKNLYNKAIDDPDFSRIIRTCAFLYKWRAQLRERFSQLFI